MADKISREDAEAIAAPFVREAKIVLMRRMVSMWKQFGHVIVLADLEAMLERTEKGG